LTQYHHGVVIGLLQVLGITNYSHWGDAQETRRCFWESEDLQVRE
jgi:hypothetical protein